MRDPAFRALTVTLLTNVLLTACTTPVDTEERRRPGVIEIGGMQPPPIQLPDTVTQGVAVVVTVTTWGSGSCTRADSATVQVDGLTAEVRPYDLWHERGVCTDDLRAYPRETALRFDESGEALVRVIGRHVLGHPAQFEAGVIVRP